MEEFECRIESWFLQYEKAVTNFLIYYMGHRDVEDLVQDTFIRALNSLDQYKGEASPKTWLLRIARNTAIDSLRKKMYWSGFCLSFIFPRKNQPR